MTELRGTTVGNLRIVDHLAKGGMGEIYVAFDEKLKRRVALKALRFSQRLEDRSKKRFLREARLLSRLDDPRICRIYDYIESDENDYLVLELIEGRNLRQVLSDGVESALRMKIAERVAEALVAAHAKGVIHRDLKPDNVMLTEAGEVKVLDFGLARSSSPPPDTPDKAPMASPSSSESTSGERDLFGTAAYMSPEQARGERVSAASDMYSFGLLLQELFSGRPAQPTLSATMVLFRAMEGRSQPVTGVGREVTTLINRLKSVAPEARPSAVETLERLRLIRDRPKRRLRRTAAALLILALLAGFAKYTFDLRRERTLALLAREESDVALGFLTELFEVADPREARGRTITALEILESGATKARQELDEQPLVRARILSSIGTVYRRLGFYDEAEGLLQEALQLRRDLLPSDHLDLAESLKELADVFWNRGAFENAEPLYQEALEIRQRALDGEHLEVAEILNNLGNLYLDLGRQTEVESLLRRALEIRQKHLGRDHPEVARSLNNLGLLYTDQGRYAEAEASLRLSLEIKQRTLPSTHPSLARGFNNLADLYRRLRRHSEAESLYKRSIEIWGNALGPEHPAVAYPLHGLAMLYFDQGRYEEAEPFFRNALLRREKGLDSKHPELHRTRRSLADLLRALGREQEAAEIEARIPAVS